MVVIWLVTKLPSLKPKLLNNNNNGDVKLYVKLFLFFIYVINPDNSPSSEILDTWSNANGLFSLLSGSGIWLGEMFRTLELLLPCNDSGVKLSER